MSASPRKTGLQADFGLFKACGLPYDVKHFSKIRSPGKAVYHQVDVLTGFLLDR